jgi:hypothetical protein
MGFRGVKRWVRAVSNGLRGGAEIFGSPFFDILFSCSLRGTAAALGTRLFVY